MPLESDSRLAMGSDRTLTRRAVLETATLGALLPARLARAATPTSSKRISLLSRPATMTRAAFVQAWLQHADAVAAEVTHLALSEVFGPEGGFDALVSAWFEQLQTPVNSGIPGARTITLDVQEHVFVPVMAGPVRVKRSLLIRRKAGMSRAAFVGHWLGVHGPLARGVPGLAGCVFNVVAEQDAARSGIDGVSESWWTGPGTEAGGKFASPQADRWNADGANFINADGTQLLLCRERLLR